MAVNRFTGAVSTNSNVAGNWSLGVVPLQADGHVATWDAASPNCTVNATLSCNNINCSGYTNTITVNTTISLESYGTVTLSPTGIITGAGIFNFRANSTLTSNGGEITTATVGTGNWSRTTTLIGDAKFGRMATNGGTWTFNKTTNEKLIMLAGSVAGGAGLFLTGDITEVQIKGVFNALESYLPVKIIGDITFSRSTFRNNFIHDNGVVTVAKNNIINLKSGYQLKLPPQNMANLFIANSGTTTLLGDGVCDTFTIDDTVNNIIFNDYSINCSSIISKLTSGTFSGSTVFNLNGLGVSSASNVSNTINVATPSENIFTGAISVNWAVAGNWSQGTIPTATDGYLTRFNSSSTNCTVNTSSIACNAISFTGYTNTLNMANTINNYGNCTLSPTMNITGVGTLVQLGSALYIGNGKIWSAGFALSNNLGLIILLGDFNITGLFTLSSAVVTTVNKTTNEKLILGGNMSLTGGASLLGDAKVSRTGGIWSAAGILNNDLEFNGDSSISGSVNYGSGIISYLSGNVNTSGSTIIIRNSTIMTVSGITWYNITMNTNSGTQMILTSDLYIDNQLNIGYSNTGILGNYNIYCKQLLFTGNGVLGTNTNIECNIYCDGNCNLGSGIATTNGNKIIEVGSASGGGLGGDVSIYVKGGVISGLTSVGYLYLDGDVDVQNLTIGSTLNGYLIKNSGNINYNNIYLNNSYLDLKNDTVNNLTFVNNFRTLNLMSDLKLSGSLISLVSISITRTVIKSDTTGVQRKLTFLEGSNMDLSFTNITDIDSSEGLDAYTYKGVLTNTNNWNQFKLFNAPSSNIFMLN